MPEPAEPVRRRWSARLRRRRTPLLIAGAGLLLGCLLGGGLVAAGLAVSDFGDQRSHGGAGRSERDQAGPDDRNRRDHNGGGRGQRRNGGDDGSTPSPSTSAAPSPSASS
jgi:hypothetical protein